MVKRLVVLLVACVVVFASCEKKAADDRLVLRYANWNLATEAENNLERRMLAAFMEAYPNIKVEIDQSITSANWMESLALAASVGNLPDVFMVNDTASMVANGWLMDISAIAQADAEFAEVPDSIVNAIKINNTLYTVPFAQFMMGYYVNRTLFNEMNLNPPQFGINLNDFISRLRSVTDLSRPTVGVNYVDTFVDFLPGASNPAMGFFTFDGEKYSLNSPEMLDAVRLASELTTTGFTYNSLTDAQKQLWVGADDVSVFRDGGMGLFWNGSWMNDSFSKELDFDWDFIGVPGNRPVITLDILTIAATSQHPEEAWLLAKWMGFGHDGYLRRIAIANEMGIEINSLPVTTNQDVLNAYWQMVQVPGILAAYEFIDNALVDGNKLVPGHVQSRFDAPTGIATAESDNAKMLDVFNSSIQRKLNFPDHAATLNTVANQAHQNAMSALR